MRLLPFDPAILQRMSDMEVLEASVPSGWLEELRDIIEGLPEEQRATVELMMYERISKAEIGRKIGRSRSYVQQLWKAALARIEHELEGLL